MAGALQVSACGLLAEEWPKTFRALMVSGWLGCEEAYYLAAVRQMSALWADRHPHRPVLRSQLDEAAAREVLYHVHRQRRFKRPCAAIWKCWQNLVVERPEKILGDR